MSKILVFRNTYSINQKTQQIVNIRYENLRTKQQIAKKNLTNYYTKKKKKPLKKLCNQ